MMNYYHHQWMSLGESLSKEEKLFYDWMKKISNQKKERNE